MFYALPQRLWFTKPLQSCQTIPVVLQKCVQSVIQLFDTCGTVKMLDVSELQHVWPQETQCYCLCILAGLWLTACYQCTSSWCAPVCASTCLVSAYQQVRVRELVDFQALCSFCHSRTYTGGGLVSVSFICHHAYLLDLCTQSGCMVMAKLNATLLGLKTRSSGKN
jgi:hypothetical protein